jgi:sugar O-acyltransferase (sialic acid O-acetyltransferase NeuD family)
MLKKVVFWGGTGHAKVLRELIQHFDWELVAVFDNNPSVPPPFDDVPLYYGVEGFRKWKEGYEGEDTLFFVTIGGARGRDRLNLQRFLQEQELEPGIAIHPTAFVAANVKVSKGSQILAHATVCTEVRMGEACILNSSSSVDHECVLGNGVHIGPGATLAGCVSVGDFSLVGAGAVVLPRIRIGSDVIVGAGSVVTKDIADCKVVCGNPARVMQEDKRSR